MTDVDLVLDQLWKVSGDLNKETDGLAWFPLVCKKCEGLLSQKMGSRLGVCLKCGCQFYLVDIADLERIERILRE